MRDWKVFDYYLVTKSNHFKTSEGELNLIVRYHVYPSGQ